MARTRTIDDMVLDVRMRANMENSEFVTNQEILEYLNQELAELRSHLRLNEGQPHQRRTRTIEVTSDTSTYDLPADFWQLLSCEASLGGIQRRLDPFMEAERASLVNSQVLVPAGSPMYRIQEAQIEFLPVTQSFTATLFYAPSEPRYRLNQTPRHVVDGYNGYEIAAIYGATASCLAKEEADPSFWEMRKDKILRLIDALAAKRDASHPERVSEVIPLADEFSFGPWWT